MKRYFIVTYVATTGDHNCAAGSIEIAVEGGGYLNRKETKEDIKKDDKHGLKNISITNIMELSESDFNDWNKE